MTPTEAAYVPSTADIAAILARRKWQILVAFLGILFAVVAGTLLIPKQYETRMKVLVKNERADMIVSANPNSSDGYRGEVSEAQINSEIELLTSNNLLQQVVIQCGLNRRQDVSKSQNVEDRYVAVEKAVKRLEGHLTVSPVRKANIIQVEYVDSDPSRAVAVLAKLAEVYLEEHLKVHATPGTYEFFRTQAQRYEDELKDAESKLAAFRHDKNIVLLAQQKDVILQKSAESESALLQAEAAIVEYKQKIANTRRLLYAAQPRVVTQNRTLSNQYSVERLHTMLAELQNRRSQLLVKFRSDDRLVQEAEREITDTQNALKQAMSLTGVDQATDVNPVHQALELDFDRQQIELAGLQSRRDVLASQTAAYGGQLIRLGDATSAFDDLVRTQKEAEDNYLLYAKKTEEARIATSLDRQKISNVAIAETPIEPHLPSKPNVPLNVALGIIFAGFISLGLAFAIEYFRDTIDKPSELEELTGLPVLATSHGD